MDWCAVRCNEVARSEGTLGRYEAVAYNETDPALGPSLAQSSHHSPRGHGASHVVKSRGGSRGPSPRPVRVSPRRSARGEAPPFWMRLLGVTGRSPRAFSLGMEGEGDLEGGNGADHIFEGEPSLKDWLSLADQGELCVYTCWALFHGKDPWGYEVLSLMPTMVFLLALQLMVPTLMLSHFMRHFSGFAVNDHMEFRVAGFILYIYSLRNMHGNAVDECRSQFLALSYRFNLPWEYCWPAIVGEAANAFAAFILSLMLFNVFCASTRPQDLVINCVAINFIGSVDVEFTNSDMRSKAITQFRQVFGPYATGQKAPGEETWQRQMVETVTHYMFMLVREVGVLALGLALAFVFLTSHSWFFCSPWMLTSGAALLCPVDTSGTTTTTAEPSWLTNALT